MPRNRRHLTTLHTFLLVLLLGASMENAALRAAPTPQLEESHWEFKWFNNLYTQTAYFDGNGQHQVALQRSSYLGSLATAQYGYTPQVMLGVNTALKSVRIDDSDASAWQILRFSNDKPSQTALTRLGIFAQIIPYPEHPELIWVTTLSAPIRKHNEGDGDQSPWVDWADILFSNQVFFPLLASNSWRIDGESQLLFRYDTATKAAQHEFSTPVKLQLSWQAHSLVSSYGVGEWAPTWGIEDLLTAYYSQVGAGIKWQALPELEIEILATLFPFGKHKGAGTTYNLGLRYLL